MVSPLPLEHLLLVISVAITLATTFTTISPSWYLLYLLLLWCTLTFLAMRWDWDEYTRISHDIITPYRHDPTVGLLSLHSLVPAMVILPMTVITMILQLREHGEIRDDLIHSLSLILHCAALSLTSLHITHTASPWTCIQHMMKTHDIPMPMRIFLASIVIDICFSHNPITLVLTLIVYTYTFDMLLYTVPASFTPSEAITVLSPLTLCIINIISITLSRIMSYVGVSYSHTIIWHVSATSQLACACQTLIVGVLVLGILIQPLLSHVANETRTLLNDERDFITIISSITIHDIIHISSYSFLTHIISIIIIVCIVEPWIWMLLDIEPFTWVFTLLAHGSIYTIQHGIWPIILCIWFATVIYVGVWRYAPAGKSHVKHDDITVTITTTTVTPLTWSSLPNIIIRKYYHLLVVIMFLPAILIDTGFMCLAMCVALSVFILLEYHRVVRLPPFGVALHAFMKTYLDTRDNGSIILTHTYLLLGCALPIWLHTIILSHIPSAPYMSSLAGILILGIGDSAASLVGVFYGIHRWPYSRKTMEGTVGAIVCVMGVIVLVWCMAYIDVVGKFTGWHLPQDHTSWFGLLLATSLTCLLEAFTVQIDNLFLPLYYYVMLVIVGLR